jgi:hypothetical protein
LPAKRMKRLDVSLSGALAVGAISLDRFYRLRYPWTTLAEMKGDPQVLRRLEEAEKLLKDLKKALAK